jgi:type IV pilus assembly protein PilA
MYRVQVQIRAADARWNLARRAANGHKTLQSKDALSKCQKGESVLKSLERELGFSETGREKGFSLIELLIVVAIILIIAAIAIPNLLRARIAANESSAVASIRTINTAMISYNSAYPTVGYSANLTDLGGTSCTPPTSTGACLIDTQLASGTKSGYSFNAVGSGGPPAGSYTVVATPLTPNQTGNRSFCSFADAVLRYSTAAITSTTCTSSVSPLQ